MARVMVLTVTALSATFVTLFPESLHSMLDSSILGRARHSKSLLIDTINPRDFAHDVHRTVDDAPAGGGAGMVMRVDILADAITHVRQTHPGVHVVLMDARGRPFKQADAKRLAAHAALAFVCGRYEGVDARVEYGVDEVISVGDFIVTGGELPALCVLDAVVRLRKGVLGNDDSAASDSFSTGLLEHRQYTRPVSHAWGRIPPVLLAGNHDAIAKARRDDGLRLSAQRRPDLFAARKADKSLHKHWGDPRVASLDAPPEQEQP
jgi:tRNA (guanine37-N1)-methyltransferase